MKSSCLRGYSFKKSEGNSVSAIWCSMEVDKEESRLMQSVIQFVWESACLMAVDGRSGCLPSTAAVFRVGLPPRLPLLMTWGSCLHWLAPGPRVEANPLSAGLAFTSILARARATKAQWVFPSFPSSSPPSLQFHSSSSSQIPLSSFLLHYFITYIRLLKQSYHPTAFC